VTQQINNIYETGDWTKDFSEVTVIALKKKPRATKYSDRHTTSLITYSVKIAARILGLSFERKIIKGVFGENNLGFRRGKGASDAMEMLRTVSTRTFDIDEESVCCHRGLADVLDPVNLTKRMQILILNEIDWRGRRFISKFCMDQRVKLGLFRRRQEM
jgi:hypothetical protein